MNISTTMKNRVKSLAIGCFDGLHLGHKELIKHLDENGILLIIDKFKGLVLCDKEDKQKLSKKELVELNFNEIKNLSPLKFLIILKKELPKLEKIVVGYDFTFGKNRLCGAGDIEKLSGIKTIIVPEIKLNGISIHSSLIKEFLQNGDIDKANAFLGRFYKIKGFVISGQGLGKRALYPTLNLKNDSYFVPKMGVYVNFTRIKNTIFKSVSFVGIRMSDENFSIETHIIENFKLDIKENEKIELFFVKFLRENAKFSDLDALKFQISKDIKLSLKFLENIDKKELL
nr:MULTISPECIES: bifunctional riboflavin kinase/FAD synthetase [unclassified Campylobacter]